MDHETNFDDLVELFEAQDAAMPAEPFVNSVMRPIHRRHRLRQAMLFGAGGIGVGAAVSQLLSWSQKLDTTGTLVDTTIVTIRDLIENVSDVPAMWLGVALVITVMFAMMITLERA